MLATIASIIGIPIIPPAREIAEGNFPGVRLHPVSIVSATLQTTDTDSNVMRYIGICAVCGTPVWIIRPAILPKHPITHAKITGDGIKNSLPNSPKI
jgi:hypothetical protein